ncbi:hypothetical protein GR210_12375 [Rhizobium leguminosarum]|uniref:hypothetical protein n=1 Tax=Rhizobium leguminosarum TaxID=384 RepID=UPI0013DAA909|nr:hypothetical protein [Rhizobium leguminosarum]NEH49578.1 hypothetical protein [Rhizobium leguminosarum]
MVPSLTYKLVDRLAIKGSKRSIEEGEWQTVWVPDLAIIARNVSKRHEREDGAGLPSGQAFSFSDKFKL